MPQNNDATEQTSGTADGNNLLETDSLQNPANESAVTNSQEYNEAALYDDPVFGTEIDSDLNFQGPRHSSPLRHRVPPRELQDLDPILPNRRRVIPLTLHRQQIDGNLHQTLDYA